MQHWTSGGVQSSLPGLAEGDRSGDVHTTKRFTLPAAEIEGAISRTLESPSLPAKVFSPILPSIALSSRFEGGWILQSGLSLWDGPSSENTHGTPLAKHCRSYNLDTSLPFQPQVYCQDTLPGQGCVMGEKLSRRDICRQGNTEKGEVLLSVLFQLNPSESSCINLLITTLNWRFIQKM